MMAVATVVTGSRDSGDVEAVAVVSGVVTVVTLKRYSGEW
jgi:hypothetical protein